MASISIICYISIRTSYGRIRRMRRTQHRNSENLQSIRFHSNWTRNGSMIWLVRKQFQTQSVSNKRFNVHHLSLYRCSNTLTPKHTTHQHSQKCPLNILLLKNNNIEIEPIQRMNTTRTQIQPLPFINDKIDCAIQT